MESNSNPLTLRAVVGNAKAKAIQALTKFITDPYLEAHKFGPNFDFPWPTGLLLYGPPGVEMTSLVKAVARECEAHLTIFSPLRVVESERILHEAFSTASSHVASGKPSVLLIEDIDALCPNDSSKSKQDIIIAFQLFSLMNSNKRTTYTPGVAVVASTYRVDAIDPALTKHGRFDTEIEVQILEPTDEIPEVTWEDIGGMKDLKEKIQGAIELPIKHPDAFSRIGVTPTRVILFYGPPGCSKTTLAKAAAHAAGASFFFLSGAALALKHSGGVEPLLRRIFRKKARLEAPSIIFFDEADVLGRRGDHCSSSATVEEVLLSTLLTEMDIIKEAEGVFVLAATNRPAAIDAALMRRFGQVLYVPPPDLEARFHILRIHTSKMKLGSDVDLRRLAEDTELFTCAELKKLCDEAGLFALREDISAQNIRGRHFEKARNSFVPELTAADIDSYLSFRR